MCIDLFDTHCHLNLAENFPEPQPFIDEAKQAGVSRLNLIGLDPDSSRRAVDIAERNEGVYAVVGRHPNYSSDYDPSELKVFDGLLDHPKVVALGEIGLDYHWEYATPQQQRRCLFDMLDLAAAKARPVVFHCREAYGDLIELLEARERLPYLFHCFAGGHEDAARALALGCTFGLDGPLTYRKSAELRELVSSLPRDRVVLETDSPYMTPEPHRGKPNKPAYLPFINQALAQIWEVGEAESARLTTATASSFFRI